jgi:hypothetical protein
MKARVVVVKLAMEVTYGLLYLYRRVVSWRVPQGLRARIICNLNSILLQLGFLANWKSTKTSTQFVLHFDPGAWVAAKACVHTHGHGSARQGRGGVGAAQHPGCWVTARLTPGSDTGWPRPGNRLLGQGRSHAGYTRLERGDKGKRMG